MYYFIQFLYIYLFMGWRMCNELCILIYNIKISRKKLAKFFQFRFYHNPPLEQRVASAHIKTRKFRRVTEITRIRRM